MVDEAAEVAEDHPERPRPGRLRLRLLGLSFLMLFVELALIRWTAAYNVHLAYLTNFVLLASFLGIGIGFLRVTQAPQPAAVHTGARWPCWSLFMAFFPVNLANLQGHLEGAFGMAPLPRWVSLTVDLPADGGRDGVHRPRRRQRVRAVRGARGLPARHPRQHRRHRRVLGAGLPPVPADRLGR